MILAFLWMKTFVNRNLYVPSCRYQMFDTSVEIHGDCCFKPSSSMKFNLFLTTMWYAARKSNGSRTAASQQYPMNYVSLLVLIICAQLSIILGEHKTQNNWSIHFISLLFIDISVGSVPRFFDSWVAPLLLSSVFLRISEPPALLYTLHMTGFFFSCTCS